MVISLDLVQMIFITDTIKSSRTYSSSAFIYWFICQCRIIKSLLLVNSPLVVKGSAVDSLQVRPVQNFTPLCVFFLWFFFFLFVCFSVSSVC